MHRLQPCRFVHVQLQEHHDFPKKRHDRLSVSRLQSDRLDAKMRMLTARMAELRQRNSGLSQEVNRLKFLNEQLRKQLSAVGDAPAQRELYRSHLAKQQLLVERLQKRVSQLEQQMGSAAGRLDERPKPPPTTQPG